ncbi:MAG: NADH-quinone oxidoreductase subunit J, partial [Bradymonadaceae bacterium]
MVLFSGDPGGKMMTRMMDLPAIERFFSRGLVHPRGDDHGGDNGSGHDHGDGEDGGGHHDDHHDDGEVHGGGGDGHQMEPMFLVQQKTPAAILAGLVWALLSALVLFRPAWALEPGMPNQHSADQIGHLLMGKYMIAFEGAGLMILLGIFGAVYLSRPGRHPDPTDRDAIRAAVDEPPAPIEGEGDEEAS